MKRPLPNTYWVVAGRLLAGEHPGGAKEADTRKRLARLLDAGIDSFIDLTEPHERPAYRELLPREVDYYQRPLPDHGVPADANAINEVLAVLRNALGAGRRVYVHCRAGIGRTGMAIACHLRERDGLDGELALAKLNELWQQNARSKSWPTVPETDQQAAFVRAWRPAADIAAAPVQAATATTSSRLPALSPQDVAATLHAPARPHRADRARGCLLGLAIGDALAVGLVDSPAGAPIPTEFRGGGPDELPPGAWSDDTAMALCQAESLLECRGVDTRDQAERYLRWLRDGHRSSTGTAAGVRPELRRLLGQAAARRSALSGVHDPRVLDSEPLARCAPAAIYFADDLEAAVEAAADAARITHQAPVLVDACRLFTALLHAALNGADRMAILAEPARWDGILRPEVIELATDWRTGADAPARRPRGAILTILDAVARAFGRAEDFRGGLLTLLAHLPSHRGDLDVAAAAYGQLAGAGFGERGLPPAWRQGLADADGIAAMADALAAARGRGTAAPGPVPQGVQSR